jgi:hypothetical protein
MKKKIRQISPRGKEKVYTVTAFTDPTCWDHLGWCQKVRLCSCPQSAYFTRDETGSVYLPAQLDRTLQLYW